MNFLPVHGGKDIGDAYQKGEWVFFGLAPC